MSLNLSPHLSSMTPEYLKEMGFEGESISMQAASKHCSEQHDLKTIFKNGRFPWRKALMPFGALMRRRRNDSPRRIWHYLTCLASNVPSS